MEDNRIPAVLVTPKPRKGAPSLQKYPNGYTIMNPGTREAQVIVATTPPEKGEAIPMLTTSGVVTTW